MSNQSDIVIMGAGLAGLTLALQLRKTLPELNVTVLDHRHHPVPERAHKIGESMVEVSSWYLREVLSLGDHLLESHLPKLGLRFFINDGNTPDVGQRPEYGVLTVREYPVKPHSGYPGIHLTTYNIDRGRLENHLLQRCREAGAEVILGCKVQSVELGKPHKINVNGDVPVSHIRSRWVIDATGRTGFLARQLDLRRMQGHFANAVWSRLNGRIDPDHFTQNEAFHNRTFPDLRWRSTNHLMGSGYWIWIIPLPDQATSVGIMTDPSIHGFERINRFENMITWLREREPALAETINSFERLDFRVLKTESYLSHRSFSEDCWALVGESAFYSDALYSPGGDFIAVGNTLVTQMIVADYAHDKQKLSILAKFGEQLFKGMFRHYLGLYLGNYSLMGRPGTILQKVAWDTAFYFAYNVLLFRNGYFCDPMFHRVIREENARLENLQNRMIRHFKTYHDTRSYTGKFIDQAKLESVQMLYRSSEERMNEKDLKVRLKANVDALGIFANTIVNLVP